MADIEVLEEVIRTRKRKQCDGKWKRNENKRRKSEGLAYEKSNGRISEPCVIGNAYHCNKQCFSFLSYDENQAVLRHFSALGIKNMQDSYQFGLVARRSVQRRRPRNGNRSSSRQHSRYYTNIVT